MVRFGIHVPEGQYSRFIQLLPSGVLQFGNQEIQTGKKALTRIWASDSVQSGLIQGILNSV